MAGRAMTSARGPPSPIITAGPYVTRSIDRVAHTDEKVRDARFLSPGRTLSAARPQGPGQERHVRRALGEAAHHVGVPLRAVGQVDPHGVAQPGEAQLLVRAHAVEHLELELVGRALVPLRTV